MRRKAIPDAPDLDTWKELHALASVGRHLDAIKLIKTKTGCEVKVAKTLFEWFVTGMLAQRNKS